MFWGHASINFIYWTGLRICYSRSFFTQAKEGKISWVSNPAACFLKVWAKLPSGPDLTHTIHTKTRRSGLQSPCSHSFIVACAKIVLQHTSDTFLKSINKRKESYDPNYQSFTIVYDLVHGAGLSHLLLFLQSVPPPDPELFLGDWVILEHGVRDGVETNRW